MKFRYILFFSMGTALCADKAGASQSGSGSIASFYDKGLKTDEFYGTPRECLSLMSNIKPECELGKFCRMNVNGLSCKIEPFSRFKKGLAYLTGLRPEQIIGACVISDIKYNSDVKREDLVLTPRSEKFVNTLVRNTERPLLATLQNDPAHSEEPHMVLKEFESRVIGALLMLSIFIQSVDDLEGVELAGMEVERRFNLDDYIINRKIVLRCSYCRGLVEQDGLEVHENNCPKNPVNN